MPNDPSKMSVEAADVVAEEVFNVDVLAPSHIVRDLIAVALDEVYRKGRESMREEAAKMADNPYSDDVRTLGYDEPSVVGKNIAAAIRRLELNE